MNKTSYTFSVEKQNDPIQGPRRKVSLKLTEDMNVKDLDIKDIIAIMECAKQLAQHMIKKQEEKESVSDFETLKKMLDRADAETKMKVSQYLEYEYVRADVESFAEGEGYDLSEFQINWVVEQYVVHKKYDCNCSYWENIENLVMSALWKKEDAEKK